MWKIIADFNEFPFDAVFFYSQEEKYYIEQLSTAMNLLQILVLSPIESQVVRLCPFVY